MKEGHVPRPFALKETLEYIHNHKTGKLLLVSVELPLIVLNVEGVKREK